MTGGARGLGRTMALALAEAGADVALASRTIASDMFTALLLMAIGSTMLTVPVVTPLLARDARIVGRTA